MIVKSEMEELKARARKELDNARAFNVPIEIGKVAKANGFVVIKDRLTDCAGYLLVDHNDPVEIDEQKHAKVIAVKESDIYERQRFTVAHELAHYFLEGSQNAKIFAHREQLGGARTQEEYEKEMRANALAAQLLIPYDLLDCFVKESNLRAKHPIDAIYNVARKFVVSMQCAEVRYLDYMGKGI